MNNDRKQTIRFVFNRLFIAAATLACAGSLQAHPGHIMWDRGAMHMITSPYHLGVLALLGFVLVAGAQFVRKQVPRRAMQVVGASALLITAVLWGVRV